MSIQSIIYLLTFTLLFINIVLMYKRQKKNKQPYGYQPTNPLTLHYITTGAILPETTFQTKKYPRKKIKKKVK